MSSNPDALYDVLINHIIPFLYRINTNPTVLIFRVVSKKTRKKLLDLTYSLFCHQDPAQIQNMVSCNMVNGIIFPGYDRRLVDLNWCSYMPMFKPLVRANYSGLNDLDPLEDRLSDLTQAMCRGASVLYYRLSWVWKKGNIYNQYQAMLPLIHDQSLTLEHRIKLITIYIGSLFDLFNDEYASMTLYRALTNLGVVPKAIAVQLEPLIDCIIDCFLRSRDLNMVTLISIARHVDVFDVLIERLRHESMVNEDQFIPFTMYRLMIVCLEVDEEWTLKYLGIDLLIATYYFNPRQTTHELEQREYRIKGKVDNSRRVRKGSNLKSFFDKLS